MTRSDITRVLKRIPALCSQGIGPSWQDRATHSDVLAEFQKRQQDLLQSARVCTCICRWLKDQPRTPHVNLAVTTNDLTRLAAQQVGPISNGQLIAAALYCGFLFRLSRNNNPKVYLNISDAIFTRQTPPA